MRSRFALAAAIGACFVLSFSLSANAHSGEHTAGVKIDPQYPSGHGVEYKIEVTNTTLSHYGAGTEFVRARVQLRTPSDARILEGGWEEASYEPSKQLLYTLDWYQGCIWCETTYPAHDLTVGSHYWFKVNECNAVTDLCAKAWILYDGSWQLLYTSWGVTHQPAFIERAGAWLQLQDHTTDITGDIEFSQGNVKQSFGESDSYVLWNPSNYPHSYTERDPYGSPYTYCIDSAWYHFRILKGSC